MPGIYEADGGYVGRAGTFGPDPDVCQTTLGVILIITDTPTPDPNARLDQLSVALSPPHALLTSTREPMNSATKLSAEVADALLELLEPFVPEAVSTFHVAVTSHDVNAPRRLGSVADFLAQFLPQLARNAGQHFTQAHYDDTIRTGALAGQLGALLGQSAPAVTGLAGWSRLLEVAARKGDGGLSGSRRDDW